MATINFQLIGKKTDKHVYLRLSINSNQVYRVNTLVTCTAKEWNTKKRLPSNQALADALELLKAKIKNCYNLAILTSNIEINLSWLKMELEKIQGRYEEPEVATKPKVLTRFIDLFIESVDALKKRKFEILKEKLQAFEKFSKKAILISAFNVEVNKQFNKYLSVRQNLSINYIGKITANLKMVLNAANELGIGTSTDLAKIKPEKHNIEKNYLSFDELTKIEFTVFEAEHLQRSKDWLILGCFLGQRVGDLLKLTKNNIAIHDGKELIELIQQKGKKSVAVPLHPKAKEILNKYGGDFPPSLSPQRFNKHIKTICEAAGLIEPTKGSLQNDKGKKVPGTFKKWELVTSHFMRRSFASNFYGTLPTSLLKSILGHATESQTLHYIGKSDTTAALMVAQIWDEQNKNTEPTSHLKVAK